MVERSLGDEQREGGEAPFVEEPRGVVERLVAVPDEALAVDPGEVSLAQVATGARPYGVGVPAASRSTRRSGSGSVSGAASAIAFASARR
jgi:hypothetical protein